MEERSGPKSKGSLNNVFIVCTFATLCILNIPFMIIAGIIGLLFALNYLSEQNLS